MAEARWEADVAARMIEIGGRLGARTGHMFGYPALYAGRRLAVCAYESGLGLKLPAARVTQLIDTSVAVRFQPYGKSPMREWAFWPAAISNDVDLMDELIAEAIEFAQTA